MQAREFDPVAAAAAALGSLIASTTPTAARLGQALVMRALRTWPRDPNALRELAASLADAAGIVDACAELLEGEFDELEVISALGRVTP